MAEPLQEITVSMVHVRQVAADPELGCESASRLLASTPTITI